MSEWNASDYHANSRLQEWLAEQHLAWLPLEGWERVLDVGCGDGKITAAIASRLPRGSAVGADPSRTMIDYATRQYATADHPNLRFEIADVRSLPFENEFDRVVSFNALHWVHEADDALRSIHRALRAEGVAFLEFVPAGNFKGSDYLVDEVASWPRWAKYFQDFRSPFAHFTTDEYRRLAESKGFEVQRIEVEDSTWDFGSREAFLGFFRTTTPDWTLRLPEAERDDFVRDCLDLYAQKNGSDQLFRFLQMEVVLKVRSPK